MQDSTRNELRRLLLFGAAVLVLVFVARAYAPALHAAFVWDDHTLLEGDAVYRRASLGEIMTRPFWPETPLADARAPYYRPLVLLSFRGDLALGGNPEDFHVTNLLLHLAACAFLGIAAVRAGSSYPSALLAMLGWGVFPRLTEAVVWVSGRTDVLAALFGLAALCTWPELAPLPRRALWTRSLLSGLLLFAACASKEVGLAFAVVMGASLVLRGGTRATLVRGSVSLGLPIIIYFGLRAAAIGESPGTRALGLGRRVATFFEASGRYGEMVIDPFHSQTSIGMLGEPDWIRVAVGVVIVLLACALAYRLVRRGSFGVRLGAVLAAAAIIPVLHIIPFTLAGAVTADRLLYVPLAGAAIALACAFERAPRWIGALVVATAGIYAIATSTRAEEYSEETKFWTIAAERAHPHNTTPRMALASWLFRAVEVEPACKLYERSAEILAVSDRADRAPHRRAREGLANCWARLGRYDESVALLQELAASYPQSARISLGLALAHLHRRDFAASATEFDRLRQLDPKMAAQFGVPPKRLAHLKEVSAHVDSLDAIARAEHFAALGRAPEASAAFYALALDERQRTAVREDAAMFLMAEGPFDLAMRAYETVTPSPPGWDTNRQNAFEHRRRLHAALRELAPRVEALTR